MAKPRSTQVKKAATITGAANIAPIKVRRPKLKAPKLKVPKLKVPKLKIPKVSPRCAVLLATPNGVQAIAALTIAKKTRRIRDKKHCKAIVKDAAKLAQLLGGSKLVGVIAGKTGECACDIVF
ncbi:MAG: hypothetical protein LC754_16430 [Acidobacteria bacterium]|nr:hypothetical protein [Acidobacteriota bacterium]